MLMMYTQEKGAYPLFGRVSSASEPQGAKWFDDITPHAPRAWDDKKWPDKFTDGVYQCPSYMNYINRFGYSRGYYLSSWHGGNNGSYVFSSFGSYGYNIGTVDKAYKFSLYGLAGTTFSYPFPPTTAVRESEVVNPSEMIALGDSFTILPDSYDNLTRKLYYPGSWPMPENNSHEGTRRHRGKTHITFADGHVEANSLQNMYFSLDEKWLRRWHIDNEAHMELFQ